MAAAISLQTRWDLHRNEIAQLRAETRQLRSESIPRWQRWENVFRRGDLLLLECDPCSARWQFITRIPTTVVQLITKLAELILLSLTSLVFCGLNLHSNRECKNCFRAIKESAHELFYLFKAAICPGTGIDAYYDWRIRNFNP